MATPHRASSVAPKAPIIRHTGKLVTAAASTGAALVSIFSFLYSYGVIGKSESHQTIGNRLRVYREQTEPLVQHYREAGLLRVVDGEGAVDEVYARLKGALGL